MAQVAAEHPQAEMHLVGHSSGGSRAVLVALHLMQHHPEIAQHRITSISTFGQPSWGDATLTEKFNTCYGDKYQRFVLSTDLIPMLPFNWATRERWGGYVHTGKKIVIPRPETEERYKRKIMRFLHGAYLLPPVRHKMSTYFRACAALAGVKDEKAFVKLFIRDQEAQLEAKQKIFITDEELSLLSPPFDNMGREYAEHMHSLVTRLLTQDNKLDRASLRQCETALRECIRDWKTPDFTSQLKTDTPKRMTHEPLLQHQKKMAYVATQLLQEREYIHYDRLSDICRTIASCLPPPSETAQAESLSDIQGIRTLAIYMAEEAERGKQGRALNARIQNGERKLASI